MSIDDLEEAGVVRMSPTEITDFLATHGTGVLGLPADGGPYLLPLSYGYDGEGRLYFTYVLGSESRKEELSDRAERATVLVYTVTTPFQWQSVLLDGRIEAVDPAEYDEVRPHLSGAWRPDVFESATFSRGVSIYRFVVEDRHGLKHTGLPPGLEPASDEDDG